MDGLAKCEWIVFFFPRIHSIRQNIVFDCRANVISCIGCVLSWNARLLELLSSKGFLSFRFFVSVCVLHKKQQQLLLLNC